MEFEKRIIQIKESLYNGYHNGITDKWVEVFINPTSREYRDCEENGMIGAFLTYNNIYIFNRNNSAHYQVWEKINIKERALPLLIYKHLNVFDVTVTDMCKVSAPSMLHKPCKNYITSHPFFKNKTVTVNYYDEAIDGDWDSIQVHENIIDFQKLRENSLADTSERNFEVQFVDKFNNYVRDYTNASNIGSAIQQVVAKSFTNKKMLGFPSIAYSIKAITGDIAKYQLKVKDTKYNVSFKDSRLQNALH